jgi:hypothetical protein
VLKTLEHLSCKALIASLCLGGNLAFGKDFNKQDRANSICKNVKVFFDYEDTLKRECGGLKFTLYRYFPHDDVMEFIDMSDSLEDIKALIKQY